MNVPSVRARIFQDHMQVLANMKNRLRFILIAGCIMTGVAIIYLTLGGNITSTTNEYPKDDTVSVKLYEQMSRKPQLENVNELMDFVKVTNHPKYDVQERHNLDVSHFRVRNNDDTKWDQNNPVVTKKENILFDQGSSKKSPIFIHKLVHLDLKGAPPRVSYYEQIFPLFTKLGVTGLLMEYEDMFPYWGSLRDLSAYNAYSLQDIKQINLLAKKHKLEIIPLVQTFGHMEFVLKQSTFMSLREMSVYPQVICPSQNQSVILIKTMIDQVVALHPHLRWLHIGSDEVYYLGSCNYCQERMSKLMWDKNRLFLDHVKSTAKYVKSKHNVQPIMWDDEFRQISEEEILKSGIHKHVEIMVWRYQKDISGELPPDVWNKYGQLFSAVWVASAFKGATGPAQYLTPISHHLENHISWLQIVEKYRHRISFRGIAITGWQRYDHFAVLCELLPASIPSLTVNLLFIEDGGLDSALLTRAAQALNCNQPVILDPDTGTTVRCGYPGGRTYEGVQQLYVINQQIEELKASNHFAGWLNQYNIDMRFSSPALVDYAYQKLQELKHNLTWLRDDMERAMTEVYDTYTVEEWFQLNVRPLEKKADDWLNAARELQIQEVWPRRPLVVPNNTRKFDSSSSIIGNSDRKPDF